MTPARQHRRRDSHLDPPSRHIGNTGAEVDDLDPRQGEVGGQTELQFERFLSETLGGLASGDLKQVNTLIGVALERLSKLMGSDVTTFQQLDQNTGELRHTHQWTAPGLVCSVDFTNEQMYDLRSSTPWLFKELAKGEPINILCLDDFPKDAANEKSLAQSIGFNSIVWVPISTNSTVRACLALNSSRQHMNWPRNVLQRLRLLGDVFLVALLRAETEHLLNNQLGFEQLLSRLSAEFIDVSSEKIDEKINLVLREVGEYTECDETLLVQFKSPTRASGVSHSWFRDGKWRDLDFDIQQFLEVFPWAGALVTRGESILIGSLDEFPSEAVAERAYLEREGILSAMVVPFLQDEKLLGLFFAHGLRERPWPGHLAQQILLLVQVFFTTLQRSASDQTLRAALTEISCLKDQLEAENELLQQEIKNLVPHGEIVGDSPALKAVISRAVQVAPLDSTVLIQGETGTGKELLAKAIHRLSSRGERKMVVVNCAALPATLIEAEIFGREKGAYTGALSKQIGRFELADYSTLFLDEIGDLPLELQPKLLRVLQEGGFERLGSSRTINVDVRVIAATNQDLEKLVRDGRFREDLYYRLNVFPITVPPLRERSEDIPILVWAFVQELAEKMGKQIHRIPKSTMRLLQTYDWPGNVRELQNIVERAMILSGDLVLRVDLPGHWNGTEDANPTLQELEREYIVKTLARTGWRVSGTQGAAQRLGLKPSTLRSRMEKLGIQRPK